MTQAGWYPDPAGQPQTFRYWDGASWTDATTGDPYAPPPGAPGAPPPDAPSPDATILAPGATPPGYPAAPRQPAAPGTPPPYADSPASPPAPPSYGPTGAGPGGGSGGGPGKVVALVIAAVVLLVVIGVAAVLGLRALGDDDSGTTTSGDSSAVPTSELSASSDGVTPSTAPTAPSTPGSTGTTDQQCKGGLPTPSRNLSDKRVTGGGLVIPVPEGYTADASYAEVFTWADDFTPLQKVIEQNDKTGWVSIYGVGGLRKANGYTDPAQAAETVMACMAASTDLYQDFTGRTDVGSESVTVDGKDAHRVVAELRVDNPDLKVTGDVAEVIVVDTGNTETFGLFLSVVPIGDQQLIDQQTAFTGQIRVR